MLVAVCDQSLGTSTSACSKIALPLSLPIAASRRSQTNSSYGETFPAVKYLGKRIPRLGRSERSCSTLTAKLMATSPMATSLVGETGVDGPLTARWRNYATYRGLARIFFYILYHGC